MVYLSTLTENRSVKGKTLLCKVCAGPWGQTHLRAGLEKAGTRLPFQSTKADPLALAPANDADQQFTQVPGEWGGSTVARETKGSSCQRNAFIRVGPGGRGGGWGGLGQAAPGNSGSRVLPTFFPRELILSAGRALGGRARRAQRATTGRGGGTRGCTAPWSPGAMLPRAEGHLHEPWPCRGPWRRSSTLASERLDPQSSPRGVGRRPEQHGQRPPEATWLPRVPLPQGSQAGVGLPLSPGGGV